MSALWHGSNLIFIGTSNFKADCRISSQHFVSAVSLRVDLNFAFSATAYEATRILTLDFDCTTRSFRLALLTKGDLNHCAFLDKSYFCYGFFSAQMCSSSFFTSHATLFFYLQFPAILLAVFLAVNLLVLLLACIGKSLARLLNFCCCRKKEDHEIQEPSVNVKMPWLFSFVALRSCSFAVYYLVFFFVLFLLVKPAISTELRPEFLSALRKQAQLTRENPHFYSDSEYFVARPKRQVRSRGFAQFRGLSVQRHTTTGNGTVSLYVTGCFNHTCGTHAPDGSNDPTKFWTDLLLNNSVYVNSTVAHSLYSFELHELIDFVRSQPPYFPGALLLIPPDVEPQSERYIMPVRAVSRLHTPTLNITKFSLTPFSLTWTFTAEDFGDEPISCVTDAINSDQKCTFSGHGDMEENCTVTNLRFYDILDIRVGCNNRAIHRVIDVPVRLHCQYENFLLCYFDNLGVYSTAWTRFYYYFSFVAFAFLELLCYFIVFDVLYIFTKRKILSAFVALFLVMPGFLIIPFANAEEVVNTFSSTMTSSESIPKKLLTEEYWAGLHQQETFFTNADFTKCTGSVENCISLQNIRMPVTTRVDDGYSIAFRYGTGTFLIIDVAVYDAVVETTGTAQYYYFHPTTDFVMDTDCYKYGTNDQKIRQRQIVAALVPSIFRKTFENGGCAWNPCGCASCANVRTYYNVATQAPVKSLEYFFGRIASVNFRLSIAIRVRLATDGFALGSSIPPCLQTRDGVTTVFGRQHITGSGELCSSVYNGTIVKNYCQLSNSTSTKAFCYTPTGPTDCELPVCRECHHNGIYFGTFREPGCNTTCRTGPGYPVCNGETIPTPKDFYTIEYSSVPGDLFGPSVYCTVGYLNAVINLVGNMLVVLTGFEKVYCVTQLGTLFFCPDGNCTTPCRVLQVGNPCKGNATFTITPGPVTIGALVNCTSIPSCSANITKPSFNQIHTIQYDVTSGTLQPLTGLPFDLKFMVPRSTAYDSLLGVTFGYDMLTNSMYNQPYATKGPCNSCEWYLSTVAPLNDTKFDPVEYHSEAPSAIHNELCVSISHFKCGVGTVTFPELDNCHLDNPYLGTFAGLSKVDYYYNSTLTENGQTLSATALLREVAKTTPIEIFFQLNDMKAHILREDCDIDQLNCSAAVYCCNCYRPFISLYCYMQATCLVYQDAYLDGVKSYSSVLPSGEALFVFPAPTVNITTAKLRVASSTIDISVHCYVLTPGSTFTDQGLVDHSGSTGHSSGSFFDGVSDFFNGILDRLKGAFAWAYYLVIAAVVFGVVILCLLCCRRS